MWNSISDKQWKFFEKVSAIVKVMLENIYVENRECKHPYLSTEGVPIALIDDTDSRDLEKRDRF